SAFRTPTGLGGDGIGATRTAPAREGPPTPCELADECQRAPACDHGEKCGPDWPERQSDAHAGPARAEGRAALPPRLGSDLRAWADRDLKPKTARGPAERPVKGIVGELARHGHAAGAGIGDHRGVAENARLSRHPGCPPEQVVSGRAERTDVE